MVTELFYVGNDDNFVKHHKNIANNESALSALCFFLLIRFAIKQELIA